MHTQCTWHTLHTPPHGSHIHPPPTGTCMYARPSEPPLRTLEGVGEREGRGALVSPTPSPPHPGKSPLPTISACSPGDVLVGLPAIIRGGVDRCARQKVLRPRGQPGISRRMVHPPPSGPPLPALFLDQQLTVPEVTAGKDFTVHLLQPSPNHLHHQMFLVGKAVEKVRAYQRHTASWWPPSIFTASEPCAPTHFLWSRAFGGFQGIRTPLRI